MHRICSLWRGEVGLGLVVRDHFHHGIWSVCSKRTGLNRKPGPPVHDDLVERDFTATSPNELWLTDITGHPAGDGKLCLYVVKDVCSGRIVGYSIYSMYSRMKSSLAVAAGERGALTPPGRHPGPLR